MTRKFRLIQDRLGVPAGTDVYEFRGHTYGLDREDTMYTGKQHICIVQDPSGTGAFITAPVDILEEYNEV